MDEQTLTLAKTAPDAQTTENAPTVENAPTTETIENSPLKLKQLNYQGMKWRVKQHHYQHQKNHLSSLG